MSFVDAGAVDFDMAVNLTRGVGQTMARLADWEVSTLVSRVEEMERGEEATGSRIGSALRLIDEVNPPFERLLIYAWRRHLAAAVGRIEAMGAKDEDLHTIDVTVGFADLVSFTALSNTLDRDEIGDLVEVFESRCQDVVARYGGRIIKSLGDSVLFVTTTAEDGVAVAEGIINVIGRDAKMPDVRLGLASGPVVQRLGDIFGPPVNMAARLTAGRAPQPAHRRPEHRGPPAGRPSGSTGGSRRARCGASGWSSRSPYAATDGASAQPARDGRWTRPLGHISPIRTTWHALRSLPSARVGCARRTTRPDHPAGVAGRARDHALAQGVPAPACADGAPG